MKTLLKVLACVLLFISPAFSQKPIREQPDVYEVGSRYIRLPPPAGFTEAFRNADEKIVAQFKRGEDPGNEIIAAYLPNAAIRELMASGMVNKTFLARISILSKFKTADVTPEEFADSVAYLEKHTPEFLDPNGPLVKSVLNLKKFEKLKNISIDQPRSLGVFERNDRVFSTLILFSVGIQDQKIVLLGAISYVHVRDRLLYGSIFKVLSENEDIETVRGLSKKWTAAIVSANK